LGLEGQGIAAEPILIGPRLLAGGGRRAPRPFCVEIREGGDGVSLEDGMETVIEGFVFFLEKIIQGLGTLHGVPFPVFSHPSIKVIPEEDGFYDLGHIFPGF
jgi:hypothetical protein